MSPWFITILKDIWGGLYSRGLYCLYSEGIFCVSILRIFHLKILVRWDKILPPHTLLQVCRGENIADFGGGGGETQFYQFYG